MSAIPLLSKKRLQLLKYLKEPASIMGLEKYITLFIDLLHTLLIDLTQNLSPSISVYVKKRLQLQARLDQLAIEESESQNFSLAENIWQQDSISAFVTLLHDIIAIQEVHGNHPILQRLI